MTAGNVTSLGLSFLRYRTGMKMAPLSQAHCGAEMKDRDGECLDLGLRNERCVNTARTTVVVTAVMTGGDREQSQAAT